MINIPSTIDDPKWRY